MTRHDRNSCKTKYLKMPRANLTKLSTANRAGTVALPTYRHDEEEALLSADKMFQELKQLSFVLLLMIKFTCGLFPEEAWQGKNVSQ